MFILEYLDFRSCLTAFIVIVALPPFVNAANHDASSTMPSIVLEDDPSAPADEKFHYLITVNNPASLLQGDGFVIYANFGNAPTCRFTPQSFTSPTLGSSNTLLSNSGLKLGRINEMQTAVSTAAYLVGIGNKLDSSCTTYSPNNLTFLWILGSTAKQVSLVITPNQDTTPQTGVFGSVYSQMFENVDFTNPMRICNMATGILTVGESTNGARGKGTPGPIVNPFQTSTVVTIAEATGYTAATLLGIGGTVVGALLAFVIYRFGRRKI